MKYFVIANDGQKFGPADITLLNQWITEGRLLPTAMLEEEGSNLQVRASTVPALRFHAPAPPVSNAPPVPQPGANPYDAPRPMGAYQPQPFQASQLHGQTGTSSTLNSQILVGWLCTIGAPVLIYFTSIGLILIFPGFRAAASLYHQGKPGHAIPLFIINGLSCLMWIAVRVAFFNHVA